MIALASPASLKGVLTPLEAAAALAAGLRRVGGVEVDEAPVADGGEGTAMVLEQSLGGDWHEARSAIHSGVVSPRGGWASPTARGSSSAQPQSGCRDCARRSATRFARRARAWAS